MAKVKRNHKLGQLNLFELYSKTNPRLIYRTSQQNKDYNMPLFQSSMENDKFCIDKNSSATYQILSDTFVEPSQLIGRNNEEDIDITSILKKDIDDGVYKERRMKELRPFSSYDNVPYPGNSKLNNMKQRIIYKAIKLVTSSTKSPTLEDKEDIRIFNSLTNIRESEYKEFLRFVEDQWCQFNNIRHLQIQRGLHSYIKEYWSARLNRVKLYPQFYSSVASIPLHNNIENTTLKVTLKHEKELLRQGTVSRIIIPTIKLGFYLNNCEELIKKRAHTVQNINHKMPVSMDPAAISLASENDADIVISSSSLKMLMDNENPSTKDWIIPIVVKDVYTLQGISKRIVYVDKPLPPEKRTTKERNEWVHKILLKASIRNSTRKPNVVDKSSVPKNEISETIELKTPSVIPLKLESDKNIQNALSNSGAEISNNVTTTATLSSYSDQEHTSDSDTDTLHIVCEEEEDISSKRCTRSMTRNINTNTTFKKEVNKTALKEKRVSPKKSNDERKKDVESNIQFKVNFYSQNTDKVNCGSETVTPDNIKEHNITRPNILNETVINPKENTDNNSDDSFVTYNLWTFTDSTSEERANMLMKEKQRKLSVLIRNKIDGCVQTENGIFNCVTICPKLEYQPEYGGECPSVSETTRSFCSLLFRPHTSLMRVRIDPTNSRVLKSETKTLDMIVNESQRIHRRNPFTDLSRLFRLLDMMSSHLSQGSYIFRHNKAMGANATLYNTTSNSDMNSFNLHQFYENLELAPSLLQQFPWNPIDPFLITEVHEITNTVPCLFPIHCKRRVPHKQIQKHQKKSYKPEFKPKMKKKWKKTKKSKKKATQDTSKVCSAD